MLIWCMLLQSFTYGRIGSELFLGCTYFEKVLVFTYFHHVFLAVGVFIVFFKQAFVWFNEVAILGCNNGNHSYVHVRLRLV